MTELKNERWVRARCFVCISAFFSNQFPRNLDWNVTEDNYPCDITRLWEPMWRTVRFATSCFLCISLPTRIYETLYSNFEESNFSRLSTVLTVELVLRKLGQQKYRYRLLSENLQYPVFFVISVLYLRNVTLQFQENINCSTMAGLVWEKWNT